MSTDSVNGAPFANSWILPPAEMTRVGATFSIWRNAASRSGMVQKRTFGFEGMACCCAHAFGAPL